MSETPIGIGYEYVMNIYNCQRGGLVLVTSFLRFILVSFRIFVQTQLGCFPVKYKVHTKKNLESFYYLEWIALERLELFKK